ncbi:MAG: HEAT repeat domain-containing protein [Ignavibacteriales bacterium]|nr:MAG: HEAT repeat domain-containing protein [Ignavibacteriales bacterium]
MDHKKYKELLHLLFIGEITDQGREELKSHISVCTECRNEMEQFRKLEEYISAKSKVRVPDKLLQDARSDLRDRLRIEQLKQNKSLAFIEKLKAFFTVNYKYVLNGAVGIAAGVLIGFLLFKQSPEVVPEGQEISSVSDLPDDISQIRNIRLIDPHPGDDIIEFSFEAVREVRMSGSIRDEKMRSILMYAVMNGNNPGVRLNSLNVINTSAPEFFDDEIKDAIISAARYDDNPGVRREALKVMKNFPFDQDVKRSYLYVILNDTSSSMRIEAINELIEAAKKGATLSSEEKELFRDRLLKDDNSYIRLQAKTVLEEYN